MLCENCKHKRNCVNGMYCTIRSTYVQHQRIEVCEYNLEEKTEDINQHTKGGGT